MRRAPAATMPKIVVSREELIAKLEARRPWAKKLDEKNLREHSKAEQAVLVEFRKRIREAAKWDYTTLKKRNYEVEIPYSRRVSCPNSVEAQLDQQLKALRLDTRKTITVTDLNENSRIYWLLTHDENAKVEVC